MKILDRFILGEFLRAFFGILAILTVILLLKEVINELAGILEKSPPGQDVLLYFLYILPGEILFAVPITVVLSMMFSLGAMAKNKELLAIHASGISYLRVALPLAVAVAVLTAMTYVVSETVVPQCNKKSRYIEKVVFEGENELALTGNQNVITKGAGNRFYIMENFDSGQNLMEGLTVTELTTSGHSIAWRIEAESAQLVERDKFNKWQSVSNPRADQDYFWEFKGATYREFDDTGGFRVTNCTTSTVKYVEMEENLDRFLDTNELVEEMNAAGLYRRCEIEAQRDKGIYYTTLRTYFHTRIAFPMAAFLLGMLGYTFAVRSSIRSFVMQFTMALITIVFYYGLTAMGDKAARNGWLPPMLGAWSANFICLVALTLRFRALERVPRG